MSAGIIILLIALFAGPIMSNVETPNFEVLFSDDAIEIREYDTLMMAKVQVNDSRKESITSGFRLLADYIFGNTTSGESIAMTAPVMQYATHNDATTWDVIFIMPSEYSLDSLPQPTNSQVTIAEVEKKRFIVLRYSGSTDDSNVLAHQAQLLDYINAHNIQVKPSVYHAFYNPPWTLPMMRRNEVMYELIDTVDIPQS